MRFIFTLLICLCWLAPVLAQDMLKTTEGKTFHVRLVREEKGMLYFYDHHDSTDRLKAIPKRLIQSYQTEAYKDSLPYSVNPVAKQMTRDANHQPLIYSNSLPQDKPIKEIPLNNTYRAGQAISAAGTLFLLGTGAKLVAGLILISPNGYKHTTTAALIGTIGFGLDVAAFFRLVDAGRDLKQEGWRRERELNAKP